MITKACVIFHTVDGNIYEIPCHRHGDVFDHPDYKYYCIRNTKKKEILSWTCLNCPHYTKERETKDDSM